MKSSIQRMKHSSQISKKLVHNCIHTGELNNDIYSMLGQYCKNDDLCVQKNHLVCQRTSCRAMLYQLLFILEQSRVRQAVRQRGGSDAGRTGRRALSRTNVELQSNRQRWHSFGIGTLKRNLWVISPACCQLHHSGIRFYSSLLYVF